ncbi:MAG TPA: hypothetical protein VMH01_08380 [Puia sp.]|nr:hypothetical protein [Puia sp.]
MLSLQPTTHVLVGPARYAPVPVARLLVIAACLRPVHATDGSFLSRPRSFEIASNKK